MQVKGETSVNKLILLFVFDKMESPLSERTLVDMCTSSNDWLNYMDCVVLIHKLQKDGFIYRDYPADQIKFRRGGNAKHEEDGEDSEELKNLQD